MPYYRKRFVLKKKKETKREKKQRPPLGFNFNDKIFTFKLKKSNLMTLNVSTVVAMVLDSQFFFFNFYYYYF